MGQVTNVRLSCYLVLLSFDSKNRKQDSHTFVTWPIWYWFNIYFFHFLLSLLWASILFHHPSGVGILFDLKTIWEQFDIINLFLVWSSKAWCRIMVSQMQNEISMKNCSNILICYSSIWITFHKVCTRFCFALFCCGYSFCFRGVILYSDIIMCTMASQITSLTIVYLTAYSGTDHRKYQNSASLAFVQGIHEWPVNSPHKGPVTRKTFPFDDIMMVASGLPQWQWSNHKVYGINSTGTHFIYNIYITIQTSNGSWCIGIKGEMSGTVCVTFTWDIYIYMSCL